MMALRWCDVDFEAKLVRVRHSLVRDEDKEWHLREPKTASGRREIPLPDQTLVALKSWRSRQAEERRCLDTPRREVARRTPAR